MLPAANNASSGNGYNQLGNYGAPAPSGGLARASVNNQSLDMMTNDIPSVLVNPSSVKILACAENNMLSNDFVFALRNKMYDHGVLPARPSPHEVAIVTLPMLNKLLLDAAKADSISSDDAWYANPGLVSEWAAPFGVVLNVVRASGDTLNYEPHGRPGKQFINVQVSRRANVKNNFFPTQNVKMSASDSYARSMDKVAIQYSVAQISADTCSGKDPKDVVVVSMVLLNAYELNSEHSLAMISQKGGAEFVTSSEDVVEFEKHGPIGQDAIFVEIGRVLHSPSRMPTAGEALKSCFSKRVYDRLAPIEIELGAP